MNESAPAALPPSSPGERWLPGPQPPREGWSRNQFLFILALAVLMHIALIFAFGTKKQVVPRTVTSVPHLQLADSDNELIRLGDPALFARPNAHDVVSAYWRRVPVVSQPNFNWSAPSGELSPSPKALGAAFREFMSAGLPVAFNLDLKPAPKLIIPAAPAGEGLPQETTLQITGDAASRRLPDSVLLPSLPWNDAIAPTKVQVLVDTAGNVASAVVLESSALPSADQRALQLARSLRFAPGPALAFGEIIFTWHTVPMTTTNAP